MRRRDEFDDDRWSGMAQLCRWGIVLLAMILVPGVAFLGQGLGRWLRTRSESGWLSDVVSIEPGRPAGESEFDDATPLVKFSTDSAPPLPAESAAMYDGGPIAGTSDAVLTAFDAVGDDPEAANVVQPVGHEESSSRPDGGQFAELERTLQEWGAVYYALEASRQSGFAYQFECIVAASNGNGAQERFTAAGRTPLEALRAVIRQVEESRAHSP
jgi:hypothetical protein